MSAATSLFCAERQCLVGSSFDSSGASVVEYAYSAYGRMHIVRYTHADLAVHNPFQYRGAYGYIYDYDFALHYLKNRFYNPDLARFISPDKVLGKIGETFSHNLYAYCAGNPVMRVDPGGCDAEDQTKFEDIDAFTRATSRLPFSDKLGAQLLDMWGNGYVNNILICDTQEWSDYMTAATWDVMAKEINASIHCQPPNQKISVDFDETVSLTNGYWPKATNYLHTGRMTMKGWAMFDSRERVIKYNLKCEWKDRIDANYSYGAVEHVVRFFANLLYLGRARDFDLVIKWNPVYE